MTSVVHAAPLDVVRSIYDAFARQALDEVLELMDPDVVIEQDPTLPWGGRYDGHDGLGRFALALLALIDSRVTIESMFQAGDQVVQHGRTAGTVRATGAPFDIAECHVWRIHDGRAVEARYFIDSAAMLEALGRT